MIELRARHAWLLVLALLGAAAALAVSSQEGAAGPAFPPCVANEDATTITQKTYTGSNGADIIQASDKDNVIYGRGGADTICAYKGADRVYGGKGRDDLWGESRSDRLYGGSQADVLRGGQAANDRCRGGDPPKPAGDPDPDEAVDCEDVKGASGL